MVPKWPLSVSYLISSNCLLFENIAHEGSFQHCTWLYLAQPSFTWLCPGFLEINAIIMSDGCLYVARKIPSFFLENYLFLETIKMKWNRLWAKGEIGGIEVGASTFYILRWQSSYFLNFKSEFKSEIGGLEVGGASTFYIAISDLTFGLMWICILQWQSSYF